MKMKIKKNLYLVALLFMVVLTACKDKQQDDSVPVNNNTVIQKFSPEEVAKLTTEFDNLKQSLSFPVVVGDYISIDNMKIDLTSNNPALSFEYTMLHVSVDSATGQTFQETAQVLKTEQLKSFCENPQMMIFKKYHLPIEFYFNDKNGKKLMSYTLLLSKDC